MIDRANHEFLQTTLQENNEFNTTFKMKSKIRGTPYFLKYFISKELENMKDSLIIAVIKEGTPNTSMITTIKTFI